MHYLQIARLSLCFAEFCPVCGLLEKGGEVLVKTVRAVLDVCRG